MRFQVSLLIMIKKKQKTHNSEPAHDIEKKAAYTTEKNSQLEGKSAYDHKNKFTTDFMVYVYLLLYTGRNEIHTQVYAKELLVRRKSSENFEIIFPASSK